MATGTVVYSAYAPGRVTPMIPSVRHASELPATHMSQCPQNTVLRTTTGAPTGTGPGVPPYPTTVPACSDPSTCGKS